jgi:sortase (surface protein transpeptidase)
MYTYVVRSQVLVSQSDVYVTAPTSRPQLTLLTCSNWDAGSMAYEKRRVVFAELAKVSLLH